MDDYKSVDRKKIAKKMKKDRAQSLIGKMLLAAALLMLANCAATRPPAAPQPRVLLVPAGVDSSVAKRADSLANQLFVEWEQQQRAIAAARQGEEQVQISEELWQALSGGDSTAVRDTVAAIRQFNRGAQQLLKMQQLPQQGLGAEELRVRSKAHLDSAAIYFETAIRFDPFDRNTRLWLAKVYQFQAERFLGQEQLSNAARVLEKLIRMDQGQHGLYGRLAQVYHSLDQWENALKNFREAETVLKESAVFNVPESQQLNDTTIAAARDSAALFLYVYYQAEDEIRLNQSEPALLDLYRALHLSRREEDRRTVQATIDWINWDDGNLSAVVFRDTVLSWIDQQKFEKAEQGFRALLQRVRTDRARREVQWRLALVEFTYTGKTEQALRRMQEVARFYRNDTTGQAAADTMVSEYYDAYGTMCHNVGLERLKLKKLRQALTYFQQSVEIPWKQRAKSYLEIARLSVNNPPKAVEAAEAAMADRQQLSSQEELAALKILISALKRQGRLREATEYFREYRQLASMVKNDE